MLCQFLTNKPEQGEDWLHRSPNAAAIASTMDDVATRASHLWALFYHKRTSNPSRSFLFFDFLDNTHYNEQGHGTNSDIKG